MAFFSNIFGTQSTAPSVPVPSAPVDTSVPQVNPPITPAAVESPLDQFKSLWEPDATPNVDGTLPANMFAAANPTKMLEAARKVDFAKSIPPAILAKITAGGPDAALAFAQAVNDVAQRSYAQSSYAATKIVEAALSKFQEGLDNRLPSQIKRHAVSESIRESNPALMHPAAAPILDAMQSQLAVKYPNATVAEIRDMASQYLTAFNAAANPAKPTAEPVGEDWGKFFQ